MWILRALVAHAGDAVGVKDDGGFVFRRLRVDEDAVDDAALRGKQVAPALFHLGGREAAAADVPGGPGGDREGRRLWRWQADASAAEG